MHRRGIAWPERLFAAVATVILAGVHDRLFGCTESTRFAVSVYLGTSALFNIAAIVFYEHILKGNLRRDLQHLTEFAIALNFLGWLTYMFEASPAVVGTMTEAITYGTFVRLMWISDGDTDVGGWRDLLRRMADIWNNLLRRAADWHQGVFFKETKS